jgi:hypothetical protein
VLQVLRGIRHAEADPFGQSLHAARTVSELLDLSTRCLWPSASATSANAPRTASAAVRLDMGRGICIIQYLY